MIVYSLIHQISGDIKSVKTFSSKEKALKYAESEGTSEDVWFELSKNGYIAFPGEEMITLIESSVE